VQVGLRLFHQKKLAGCVGTGHAASEVFQQHADVEHIVEPKAISASLHFDIIDGAKQDALDLADQCMAEWKAFFKQDSITLPEP
jgi:hypothetical protein